MNYTALLRQLAVISAVLLVLAAHVTLAADAVPVGQTDAPPLGQEEETITAQDAFGEEGGNFHPFLMFEALYTDNLFYTSTNTKSDLVLTLAPGIWLAFPANKEKLLDIGTSSTSPGGLLVSRVKPEANRRYQTYFAYSPQFIFYKDYSEHDHVNHRLEGLFQYNFASGLSIDLIDQYNIREEINDSGTNDLLYKYVDNILSLITTYEPSEKFKFRFDYSNYTLEYDELFNAYRDRVDNTFAFYLFYKIKPKTSIFGQYEFADIDFDLPGGMDSQENRYYGGLAWEMTAKTQGQFKVGWIDKDFEDPAFEDDSVLSLELQLQHSISGNKSLTLTGYRRFNESTLVTASHFSVTGINAGYLHRFNTKWSGSLTAGYSQEIYEGIDRDDDVFRFSPALRFKPKNWLFFDMGYQFVDRDSSIPAYDFTANILYFRGNISL